jgi:hypothetical protein
MNLARGPERVGKLAPAQLSGRSLAPCAFFTLPWGKLRGDGAKSGFPTPERSIFRIFATFGLTTAIYRSMRPLCHISERVRGCCDICGNWPNRLHMPEDVHGWYCAKCCPVCKAQPVPQPAPASPEPPADQASQAA